LNDLSQHKTGYSGMLFPDNLLVISTEKKVKTQIVYKIQIVIQTARSKLDKSAYDLKFDDCKYNYKFTQNCCKTTVVSCDIEVSRVTRMEQTV